MDISKQFLTIGLNGVVEAAEHLGYNISNNEAYKTFLAELLAVFKAKNKEALQKYGYRFNTEFVPKMSGDVKPLLIYLKCQQWLTRGKRKAA